MKATDIIIVDNGDMFEGTREQFANNFFSNADDHNILDWCIKYGWSVTINGRDSQQIIDRLVHLKHCNPKDGCKYGDESCPVVNGDYDENDITGVWHDYEDEDEYEDFYEDEDDAPTQPKLTEVEYLYQINVILSKLGLFYMEQFYSDNTFTWLFSQHKGKRGNLAELTFAYDFSTIEATFYFNDSESKLTNMSFEEIYNILAKKL